MSNDSFKQFDDFIEIYEKLYHIEPNESIEEILDLLIDCLIDKYNRTTDQIISSILRTAKYNYRSIRVYSQILNEILDLDSHSSRYVLMKYKPLIKYYRYIVTLKFPKESDIEIIIMNDQIDKFKEYIIDQDISDISINLLNLKEKSLLEVCAYFGAVNIFYFLHLNLGHQITERCLKLAIYGRNTDIINECLKHFQANSKTCKAAIISHNNIFLKNIMHQDLMDKNIPFQFIVPDSQNLKALILLYQKDKNLIIPYCSAFPQTLEILKNESFDLSKITSTQDKLLHYAARYNNFDICKYLLSHQEKYHTNVNDKDSKSLTSLHYAAEINSEAIAQLLILHGADINSTNDNLETPLHFAALNNSIETYEVLVNNGAEVDDRALNHAIKYINDTLIEKP